MVIVFGQRPRPALQGRVAIGVAVELVHHGRGVGFVTGVARDTVLVKLVIHIRIQSYRVRVGAGATVHRGGSFVTVEGPRFSTKAESRVFRSWGMDIIGMTTTPEAQLAREAEMSYAVMAHITDYDVWHESEEPVTVEMVVRTLLRNAEVAKQGVVNAIRLLKDVGPSPYAEALRDALITNRAAVPPQVVERLDLLVGKYFA